MKQTTRSQLLTTAGAYASALAFTALITYATAEACNPDVANPTIGEMIKDIQRKQRIKDKKRKERKQRLKDRRQYKPKSGYKYPTLKIQEEV